MGSTRVVEDLSDVSAVSSVNLGGTANHTEITPSRVLGKNLHQLGDYQLVKKLGEGAMGAVYKAKQISDDGVLLDKPRTVALKVLFSHIAKNKKLVERLYREGQVMGRLDHPNIITATAIGEAEGCHYVAMEYVSGQSMQKWMTQLGRIPVADAVRVTIDCARALTYAHGLGMVHRDIKPDNILVTKRGAVKVADLGMVKIEDESMSLTQTGHAVGTPWYMPLEQAKNAKNIEGRSDIYALGCTLYAFITGKPPFAGETIVEVFQGKQRGTFPPARQSNPDVPERLDLIIMKMTAKDVVNRYKNCEDVIVDLESLGLASATLSFLDARPTFAKDITASDDDLAKTTVIEAAIKTSAEHAFADVAAPAVLNPDVWFVQMKQPDGTTITRRYTTAQLVKMLDDGTIYASAKASHTQTDGFRGLGTYREFQGAALTKVTKKAADKITARTRGEARRLDFVDQRPEKEERDNEPETAFQANLHYWLGALYQVLPLVLAVLTFVGVLYASAAESGWGGTWWAPAVPALGLVIYYIRRIFFDER